VIDGFRERLAGSAVLLDFDGTLAPIVARPEDARPLLGTAGVLSALAPRVRALAIVTGRPSTTVRALLGDVPGVRIIGLYGFEDLPPVDAHVLETVEAVSSAFPGTQIEPKGASVAVHFRNAPDPDAAGAAIRPRLESVAEANGMRLLEGKRVWELAPADAGGKGEAVAGVLAEVEPTAVLYAGDDLADLEAFDVLDRVGGSVLVWKVAVLGDETPAVLREAADEVVEGPAGLLELLRGL
jgi:trehalose 6-phosphate phosphatase